MKKAAWLLATLSLVGCATADIERTLPDGSTIRASSARFMWHTQNFKLKVTTKDGVVMDLSLDRSGTDAAAIEAMAQGIASGVIKGIAPTP